MKSVLITGAAGGIGGAAVRLFAGRGWRVFAIDKRPAPNLSEDCEFAVVDLAKEDEIRDYFVQLGARVSGLDVLVNNAAHQICSPLLQTTVAEWDDVMAVNLRGPFLVMREAYPLLAKCVGSIVNVGSVHARATSVGIAAYAASKGGVESLTRAAALEFAPVGIRVNGIHPGAVDTAMLIEGLTRISAGASSAGGLETFAAAQLLGRVGRPEEIAEAILFLADGQRSGFMTGSFLVADGGALCRLSTEG